MVKPLNQYTTEALQEELAKRSDDYKKETDNFLTQKGIKQHEGKGVTIWADDLAILLEGLIGDKEGVSTYKIEDNLHFNQDDNRVTLLESAIAGAEETLSIINTESIQEINDLYKNFETINHTTLADIGEMANNIEIEQEEQIGTFKFNQLSELDNKKIIEKIIGISLNDMRKDAEPSHAPAIHRVVNRHIRTTIITELKKMNFDIK